MEAMVALASAPAPVCGQEPELVVGPRAASSTTDQASALVRDARSVGSGREIFVGAMEECKSGHPVQVAYSDTTRATGVVMRRAWARSWVAWGDTNERQPRTCEWGRAVARYLAFNGRCSGARLAPAVLASADVGARTGVVYIFLQRPPAYRTIKLASRGGECDFLVRCEITGNACELFAFNRRQLLVPSSHRADREIVRGSCWSSPGSQDGDRLMRHRLAATRCLQARLTARRTLGRARVTPLDALGLQTSCLSRPLSPHGASVRPNI